MASYYVSSIYFFFDNFKLLDNCGLFPLLCKNRSAMPDISSFAIFALSMPICGIKLSYDRGFFQFFSHVIISGRRNKVIK